MALKVLLLRKKLSDKQDELKKLREISANFSIREAELEKAIAEASTDEEKKIVEDSVTEFEKEKGENSAQDKTLSDEIESIEREIEAIEKSSPAPSPTVTQSENSNERKGNKFMETRKFFGMTAQQRDAFMSDDKVKEFLQRVREKRSEQRSVSGADLLIPEIVLGVIRENVEKHSKLLKYVTVKPVTGKARQTIGSTIPEAIWTEMISNFNEMDLSFSQVQVDGFKVGGYIPVANSTLSDASDLELASEVIDAISKAIGKALDKAIIYGTSKRMPLGIVPRLAQSAKPDSWDNDAPDWTDLHLSHVLKRDLLGVEGKDFFKTLCLDLSLADDKYGTGGLFWAMNKRTKAQLMTKSLDINAAGAIVTGVNNQMPLVGGDIVELEFMPDNEIVGGYGCQYLLAQRQGGTFKTSEHCRFLQDQTVFLGYARYDGMPVFGEGFVALNFANTNVTTAASFAGDSANTDLVSLSELKIGATPVTLYPPFNKDVLNYYCEVSAHSQKITATALKSGAEISIKKGDSAVTNGSNTTFSAGENQLTVEVTNGNATKRTYTVVVKDITA